MRVVADLRQMPMTVFLQGFAVAAPLIMAIGAQNLFVLRQGILRRHVVPVVVFCALMDAVLIAAGVGGLGSLLGVAPMLRVAMALAGSGFLIWYGAGAGRRAAAPGALDPTKGEGASSLAAALARAAAFTLLNPHVYLDTVLLIGSIGATQATEARPVFVAGAAFASVVWFTGLGFGARLLAPILSQPRTWRVIEAVVAVMMFAIAAKLLWGVVEVFF